MRRKEESKFRPENNTGDSQQIHRKPTPLPILNRTNGFREKAPHCYGSNSKREHIGKSPGGIVNDMELAGLKEQVPNCRSLSE